MSANGKNGKSDLHPGVQIDLLRNLGKELSPVVKRLGQIRANEWEVLKPEYCFYRHIHPNDREARYKESEYDIWCRLEAFSGGQVTSLFEGRPLGLISGIRRNRIFGDWNEEVTHFGTYRSHESDGKIFGCCEITVDQSVPREITRGVAKAQINKEIELYHELKEKGETLAAVAKTRPYGIIDHMREDGLSNDEIKKILKARNNLERFVAYLSEYIKPGEDGRMRNPVLNMHHSNGAKIYPWGIEYGTRCFDRKSGGSTIIAIYDGMDFLEPMARKSLV
jgi:hypothetical protein